MKAVLAAFALVFVSQAFATINGSDDRKEAMQEPRFAPVARATALMLSPAFITENANGKLDIEAQTLGDPNGWNVCKDEKFTDQPAHYVNCTGFLIAPDLLLTAGHCAVREGTIENVRNEYCENFNWIFDWSVDAGGKISLKDIDKSRMVGCKRVVYATLDFSMEGDLVKHRADFAIIELERAMVGRTPLKLASVEPKAGDLVSMVGHPTGLPAKSVADAPVFVNEHANYFTSGLDAMGGNSGSPILNTANEVVGILVRAFPEEDYVDDAAGSCRRPNKCAPGATGCTLDDNAYARGAHGQKIKDVLSHIGR